MKILSLLKSVPAHTYLFAWFPVVFLYSHNADEVLTSNFFWQNLFALLCGLFVANAILFLAVRSFFKGSDAWAILLSVGWVFLFLPVDIVQLSGWRPFFVLLGLLAFYLVIALSLWLRSRPLPTLSRTFHYMALFLIVSSAGNLTYRFAKFEMGRRSFLSSPEALVSSTTSERPDVYYIITDMYPDAETLKEVFAYDNGPFVKRLQRLGFYFPKQARTNYPFTRLSVPSSFAADYLDKYAQEAGETSTDLNLPLTALSNSRVVSQFRKLGYKFITFTSSVDIPPLQRHPQADVVIDCGTRDPLFSLVWRKTAFNYLFKVDYKHDQIVFHRESLRCILSRKDRLPQAAGPKFVFAYFLSPHPPWVFGRNGEEIFLPVRRDHHYLDFSENRRYYIDQLHYWNTQLLEFIESIVKGSKNRPIVVLQSDHGTGLSEAWRSPEALSNPSDSALRELMGILSAYYVPPAVREALYDTITPVNTFRLIWKKHFNLPIDLLPDRVYYSNYSESPYRLADVTDRLKRLPGRLASPAAEVP